MKKLFYRIVFFVSIVFVVDKPLGMLLSKGGILRQQDNRVEKLVKKEIDSEILIFGSSMAANGINPRVLSQILNKSSYNLAFSGSNIAFQYSILNMIDQEVLPSMILLTVNDRTTFIDSEKAIYRKDKLFPFIKYDKVLEELCKNSKKNYAASKVSWIYRNNQNIFDGLEYIKSGKKELDETNHIDENGYIALHNSSPLFDAEQIYTKGKHNYDRSMESNLLLESMEKFIHKCNQLNIELVIVRTSALHKNRIGFDKRMEELIDERAVYIDFADLINDPKYFFDEGHLNSKGADLFTYYLSNKLKNGI